MRVVVGIVLVLARGAVVAAHPLAPSLLELREHDAGRVDVQWKVPVTEVPGLAATPVLPAACRDASPRVRASDGVGVATRWTIECGESLVGQHLGVTGLGPAGAVVRIVLAGGRVAPRPVLAHDAPFPVPPAGRAPGAART